MLKHAFITMFGKKKDKKEVDELYEKLERGAIRTIITLEVVGKPQKHVEDALKLYVDNLKKDSRITFIKEDFGEAIEEEGLWSTFAELEVVVNELSTLVWVCINFSPASIEILEPSEKVLSAAEITAWINDLLSKLHEVSGVHREVLQKNASLNESLNALIKNAIITALSQGPQDAKAISKQLGIHHDQLEPFFKHLVERGRVKKKKDLYSL